MKELSIEEKAKAYDDALEKAKQFHNGELFAECNGNLVEYIFPELCEPEDEKIRKAIHIYLDWLEGRKDYAPKGKYSIKDMIAWLEKQGQTFTKKDVDDAYLKGVSDIKHELEKQGEQKPYDQRKECLDCQFNYAGECKGSCQMKRGEQKSADKIEPKFKVGEWITHNTANFVFKIINVGSNGYEVVNRENYKKTISFDNEDNYHLWTIQDAKDGDVLYSLDSNQPFIYKEMNRYAQATAYCGLNIFGRFFVWDAKDCVITLSNYVPATKEQRDLLFAKMEEAGYEWNAEKKELKKVEPKSAVIIPKFRIGDNIKTTNEEPLTITKIDGKGYWSEDLFICNFDDADKWELVEQKPAWSEEDEVKLQTCIDRLQAESLMGKVDTVMTNWLKSLKERINEKQ